MKTKYLLLWCFVWLAIPMYAQEHIPRLELSAKEKLVFSGKDSIIHLKIDTLIMKDRSVLNFFNKKQVILEIGYAEIGEKVKWIGQDGKNNGSNFDVTIHLAKMGNLYVDAGGLKATRGRNALPHGNGGHIQVSYSKTGIAPQISDRKAPHYFRANVIGGDNVADSRSEIQMLQSQIGTGQMALAGLPQGRIYSGTPGNNGTVSLKRID